MGHVVMVTKSGEQHGLINVLTNSVTFDGFKNMTPEMKTKCEKEKKEDARLVKVKYINARGKHERLSKPYCRWSGDPIQQWHLIPGHVYEVPMGLVNEVNSKKLPKRSGLVSTDGEYLNKDETPLEKDEEGEALHMLVPATF